jgi:hypothetical protein
MVPFGKINQGGNKKLLTLHQSKHGFVSGILLLCAWHLCQRVGAWYSLHGPRRAWK